MVPQRMRGPPRVELGVAMVPPPVINHLISSPYTLSLQRDNSKANTPEILGKVRNDAFLSVSVNIWLLI